MHTGLEWTGKPVRGIVKEKRGEAWRRTYDDVQKSLAFDIKRDVFDDNGRGYNLVFRRNLIGRWNTWGGVNVWERRRASTRRQIRIIRRRHRAIVRIGSAAIEPLLQKGCIWG
jgi:hypothetical protein